MSFLNRATVDISFNQTHEFRRYEGTKRQRLHELSVRDGCHVKAFVSGCWAEFPKRLNRSRTFND